MGIILAEVLGLLLCFVVPFAGLIGLQMRYKKCIRPFLFGMLAFIVSQMILRSALLQFVLPQTAWYVDLQYNHYYGYWIFLGLTAGIFEELARWICFRFLLRKESATGNRKVLPEKGNGSEKAETEKGKFRAVAFGFGHGGAEAMLLTGVNYLNLILCSAVLFHGGSLTEAFGLPEAQAQQLAEQIQGAGVPEILMGGVERIIAIAMHIGFTLIVYAAVWNGKRQKRTEALGVAAAVLLHGGVDASLGFLQAAGIGGYALEGILFGYALLLLWIGWCTCRHIPETDSYFKK